MNIQLRQDGKEIGPFPWIEVFVMLQKGAIEYQTPARFEGESVWRTIDDLGLWREGDEIGPFTWEEISYLVSEGCLDSVSQVRLEGKDALTTLAEVTDIDDRLTDSKGKSNVDEVPKRQVQEISRRITSIFSTSLAVLESWRLRKKDLVYAAFVLSGFFAGWIVRGAFVESPALPLQSGISPARPVSAQESVLPQEPPPTEAVSEPLAASSPAMETPETVIAIDPDNKEEALTSLSVSTPKEGIEEGPPEIKEELFPPTVSVAEASPHDAGGKQDASPVEAPLSVPKPESQISTVETSTQPSPSPALLATREPKTMEEEPPQKIVPAKPQTAPRIERLRPFDTPQLTQEELEELLQERFSSTPIKILDSYDERPGVGLKIHEGSFTLETKLTHNPTVEVIYRVPLASKNRPGPDADNVVMVGLYHGGIQPSPKKIVDGKEIREKSRLHGALTPFADRLGYTAFTIHVATAPEMAADKREYYAFGGPDWVDVVFRAKAEIERLHKLKDRKLLLFGTSEGGQFVQNIAAAAPDRIAAITAQSGPNITPPEESSATAWFLAITRGDGMQAAYESVYNRLLEQEATVVFNIFPPNYKSRGLGRNFYHSQHPLATLASRSFLRAVVDRSDSRGGIDRTRWPYVRDRTKPLRIYSSGSAQARSIPPENREYLPSRAFAQCMQAIPAPMQSVTLTTDGIKRVKAFVGVPPLGKPKGVIVYSQAFNIMELQHMFDNIYFLAAMGYVVIAPQMRKNDPADILEAMRFTAKSSALGKHPMAVLGYGPKANLAWDVIARNRDVSPKAVAMLEFTPQDCFDESKLPPGCRMEAPVVFVYDEQPLVDVATSDEARKSGEIVAAVKDFVTNCKERSQLARVVIVPKPEPKKNARPIPHEEAAKLERTRVAQLSLEAAESFISNVVEQKTSRIAR